MNKVFSPRILSCILIIALLAVFFTATMALADVSYDFVNQDGDIESKFGNIVKAIATTIIGIGLGFSIICVAYGAAQFFGRLFEMDKEKGMDRIKTGLIGIIFCACFWPLMNTAFSWAGL